MAFVGCVLVSGFTGGRMPFAAIVTGIGSGLGYALYSILGSVALKKYRLSIGLRGTNGGHFSGNCYF